MLSCVRTWYVVHVVVLLLRSSGGAIADGCSEPSPCTLFNVENFTPVGEDIITSLNCENDNTLSIAWNWRANPTCLIDTLRLRYTCSLLPRELDGEERQVTYPRLDRDGTGSWVVEQGWSTNSTYTVECEVGGVYEIKVGKTCVLRLPRKRLNATCSIPSKSSAMIHPATTTIRSTPPTTHMPQISTIQPMITNTPSRTELTAEKKGMQQLPLIAALVASSVVVVVAVLSTFMVIILLSQIRSKYYHPSTFKDFDVFEPDYFPVEPAKKMILGDNISLKSKISPLESPEKTNFYVTKVQIVLSEYENEEENDEILQEDSPKKSSSETSLDSEERHISDKKSVEESDTASNYKLTETADC